MPVRNCTILADMHHARSSSATGTTHTLSPPGIAEALLISVQTDSIRIRVPAPGLLCSASVTYHQLDRYERERYAAIWGAMTYERSG